MIWLSVKSVNTIVIVTGILVIVGVMCVIVELLYKTRIMDYRLM